MFSLFQIFIQSNKDTAKFGIQDIWGRLFLLYFSMKFGGGPGIKVNIMPLALHEPFC